MWDLSQAMWSVDHVTPCCHTPLTLLVAGLQSVLIASCVLYFVWKRHNSNKGERCGNYGN